MGPPKGRKGEVVIRTRFGEVAADGFSKPIDELLKSADWREAVKLEGGPFCYTDFERRMAF